VKIYCVFVSAITQPFSHFVYKGWVKHTQVCNFCISEVFNEIESKYFSNTQRYSSLCVISFIRQSVAQKLGMIHVFYALCRPILGVRVLKQNSLLGFDLTCVGVHQKRVNVENAIIMTSCSTAL